MREQVAGLVGAAIVPIVLLVVVSMWPSVAAARQSGSSVVVVGHLTGIVNPVSAAYVHRLVGGAVDQHAALMVLEIDTPGGLDTSMREMVQDLLNSPVPSVGYVAPAGARAASAGVFIAEAANVLAMAPGTNIGAAHPIQQGGQDIPGDLRQKVTNDAAAYIGSVARQRGRNDAWVRDAVRQSVSIGADEAVDQHVADLVALDLRALLAAVDGRSVTTASGPTTIAIAEAEIRSLDPTPVELIADKVFEPTIAYLLMTIGFFAILTELFHPGALVPGVSGVVCLVLSFVGFASLPMNWGGVVLIVAAAALFILDIKAAAHGGLTIAGLICFVIGSMLLYSPPPGGLPSATLPDVSVALPALVGAAGVGAAFSLLVVRTAMRMAGRPSITGAQRLSGATGVARTNMDPDGTVTIRGQAWSARIRSGRLEAGQAVRVVGRTGLMLEVEPVDSFAVTGHLDSRNGVNR